MFGVNVGVRNDTGRGYSIFFIIRDVGSGRDIWWRCVVRFPCRSNLPHMVSFGPGLIVGRNEYVRRYVTREAVLATQQNRAR